MRSGAADGQEMYRKKDQEENWEMSGQKVGQQTREGKRRREEQDENKQGDKSCLNKS